MVCIAVILTTMMVLGSIFISQLGVGFLFLGVACFLLRPPYHTYPCQTYLYQTYLTHNNPNQTCLHQIYLMSMTLTTAVPVVVVVLCSSV